MKLSELEAREDLHAILQRTLEVGWSEQLGRPVRVLDHPVPGSQPWLLHPTLSAVFTPEISRRGRRFVADAFRYTPRWARAGVKWALGTFLSSRAALVRSARPAFWVDTPIPGAADLVAVPGNQRVRLFDLANSRCRVLIKHGFATDSVLNEARVRGNGRTGPFVKLTAFDPEGRWFEEPLLEGSVLMQLPPWHPHQRHEARALAALDRWHRQTGVKACAARHAAEVRMRLGARLPTIAARYGGALAAFLGDEADRLAEDARTLGEIRVAETHGDVQPGNILVDPAGEIVLLDWEYSRKRFDLYDALVPGLRMRRPRGLADRINGFVGKARLEGAAAARIPARDRAWRRASVALVLLEELDRTATESLSGTYRSMPAGLGTLVAELRALRGGVNAVNAAKQSRRRNGRQRTVLVAHNHYTQTGGEDRCFADEVALLEAAGHRVVPYTVHNDAVTDLGLISLAKKTLWNGSSHQALRRLMRRERPDVAHFHNTLPLISPAAYYAARAEGVAVVQTLHNYRLICPSALLFRDGKVCESCVGRSVAWPGVLRGCYRGSRAATAAVAAMTSAHRAAGTWANLVDVYVALTQFSKNKFVAGGLPAEKIAVKPNFLAHDPGPGQGDGGYALYVGRLSAEKGTDTLTEAWAKLGGRMPLKVVGDGPLAERVREQAARLEGVEVLGFREPEEVGQLMAGAALLIQPSLCYENLPRTVVEAYAAGTPVVASDLGSLGSLVDDGRTGLLFRAGDSDHLAERIGWLLRNPRELMRMRGHARTEFSARYSGAANLRSLVAIYDRAIATARDKRR